MGGGEENTKQSPAIAAPVVDVPAVAASTNTTTQQTQINPNVPKLMNQQFVSMAKRHEKMPFMEESDLQMFQTSMKTMETQNTINLVISSTICTLAYRYFGGMQAPAPGGSVFLRRLRHCTAIGFPAFFLPVIFSTFFPSQSFKNIKSLSQKYESKVQDPLMQARLAELKRESRDSSFQKPKPTSNGTTEVISSPPKKE